MSSGYGVFDVARGEVKMYLRLPGVADALAAVLLQAAGQSSEEQLRTRATLAAITDAGNLEASFTGYTRRLITALVSPGLRTIGPDPASHTLTVTATERDLVWAPAGGATNNILGRIVIAYVPDTRTGDDARAVPLFYAPFSRTTDGSPLTARIHPDGLWRTRSPT